MATQTTRRGFAAIRHERRAHIVGPQPNQRYRVYNEGTQYTLFSSDDLKRAKHIFRCVSKRKHGDIILMDTTTGEVLKIKYKLIQEVLV